MMRGLFDLVTTFARTRRACPGQSRLSAVIGGEAVAAGKAAEALAGKVLARGKKTEEALLRLAEDSPEMRAAAQAKAARLAVKERLKLKFYEPLARVLGVSKAYFEDAYPQEVGVRSSSLADRDHCRPLIVIAMRYYRHAPDSSPQGSAQKKRTSVTRDVYQKHLHNANNACRLAHEELSFSLVSSSA